METNYPLTAKINEAYVLLNKHGVYFYTKKVVGIVLEILSYLMALGLLIGLFLIPDELEMKSEAMNSNVNVKEVWQIRQVTVGVQVARVAGVFFVVLFLFIGLLFGYIRRKDNRIRQAALLLETVLNHR